MDDSIDPLARKDLQELKAYKAAQQVSQSIRLNANELPNALYANTSPADLHRYPELQASTLQSVLASKYHVSDQQLMPTRGSSEAIDLLIRSYCEAYRDSILVVPPTFDMYRVYAKVQGANVLEAPMEQDQNGLFQLDADNLLDRCDESVKLIFLCSPNNPTGNSIELKDIVRICNARHDQSLVIVDEAYIEFSSQPSVVSQLDELDNLVVLRTLSKAGGLAGARIGALIARPKVIHTLSRIRPPYTISSIVSELVCSTLQQATTADDNMIENIINERQRMTDQLASLANISKVWPSDANFLLVKFNNGAQTVKALKDRGILIRDVSATPELQDCARITVGSKKENNALLKTLQELST